MNDRFKFRVFIPDKKNSKNGLTGMFKVHSLHTGTNKAIITSLYGNCSIKLENNILMQCTGLKDKNGKLIYEGDIITYDWLTPIGKVWRTDGKRIVEWNDGFGVIGNIAGYDVENGRKRNVEVIGNIYENKELLENEGQNR